MSILDRRSFVQLSSAAAASFVRTGCSIGKAIPIGVQLFTLRKEVQTDLAGTLAAAKEIGFQTVETFSGMYQRPAADLRRTIEDAGPTVRSAHFAYDTLEASLDDVQELGATYVVCATLPKASWTSDSFRRAAEDFNIVGAKAKSMNLKLTFHNHNSEFQPLQVTGRNGLTSDITGLEILLDQTYSELVSWEEDCYWVAQGGQNPLVLLERYLKRVPLTHLKDRRANATVNYTPVKESQFYTEVGAGTIDWVPILKIAVE